MVTFTPAAFRNDDSDTSRKRNTGASCGGILHVLGANRVSQLLEVPLFNLHERPYQVSLCLPLPPMISLWTVL